ncbi:MAG: Ig-like domain-containing protein [Elusimicrobia bacterium]|nr:Ig-like domain-containing protein [Elusimicrobiota bacterium]
MEAKGCGWLFLPAALLLAAGVCAPRGALAADLLIQDFSSGLCTPDNLGAPAGDDGTMQAISCSGGVLRSTWDANGDYYYSTLTSGTSGYDLSGYDYISFDFRGSSAALNMSLRLKRGSGATVDRTLNSWSAESLPTGGLTRFNVPISDYFTATQSTAVYYVSFALPAPVPGWMEVDNIYARKETELKVLGVDIISSDTVRVGFNVPVGAAGDTAGNYSLSPALTVASAARRDNNRVVQLKLASALAHNTTYTLTVNTVSGANGAVLGSNNTADFIGFSEHSVFMDNFNREGQSIVTTDVPGASWTWNDLAPGNWLALSTATRLYGDSSLFVMDASTMPVIESGSPGGPAGIHAGLFYTTPTRLTKAYYRLYFYAPSRFFSAVGNGYDQKITTIDNNGYTKNVAFHLTKVAGAPMGYLEANSATYGGNIPITPDRWNCLEIYISTPSASAPLKAWLNGNRIANIVGAMGTVSWRHFYIGLEGWNDINPLGPEQRGLYYDEVVVSSLTYIGQIEKPYMVYASATAPNTVKVYYDRAVSPNEPQWQNTATYSFYPPLTVNSAVIEDDFRTVSLNTSLQSNATVYALSVNPSYLQDGMPNSANFIGLSAPKYLVDDFNRPNNSTLVTDSPMGVWDAEWDGGGANSVTVSTSMAFRTKASLKCDDVSATQPDALLVKNVNLPASAYARFYLYLGGNFFTAMSNGQSRVVMEMAGSNQLCNSGNSQPCSVSLYVQKNASGQQRLGLEFNDTADLWPGDYNTYVATGVWNSIEVLVPATGAAVTANLYVNGSLTASVPNANISDAGYWSDFYLGLGWASAASFQQTAYYDEVVVSTSGYIGPLPDYTSACGLKYYDGSAVVQLACEKPENLNSQLRVYKAPSVYGVVLTDIDDPNASKIRVNTVFGPRAIRKY